jgi:hypothetical protein
VVSLDRNVSTDGEVCRRARGRQHARAHISFRARLICVASSSSSTATGDALRASFSRSSSRVEKNCSTFSSLSKLGHIHHAQTASNNAELNTGSGRLDRYVDSNAQMSGINSVCSGVCTPKRGCESKVSIRWRRHARCGRARKRFFDICLNA